MKTLAESVINSMDGSDKELLPFLPYIFQDIFELGSSPEIILRLIRKHMKDFSTLTILDLGCGKGAVSIGLAKELKCQCVGIDAVEAFIIQARTKAREHEVQDFCCFEVGDVLEMIKELLEFDIIILGALGPIFGDYDATLTTLSKHLKQNGIIIIDDSYIEDDNEYANSLIPKRKVIMSQIQNARMQCIDEAISTKEEIQASNVFLFENIKKRCRELIVKHPDKAQLFENYIQNQEKENSVLEEKVVSSTLVIRKN